MTWTKLTPEAPISTFEGPMYPLVMGRTYRGTLTLPEFRSGVPQTYEPYLISALTAAFAAYGNPTLWQADQQPKDWPAEDDVPTTASVIRFQLVTFRDGVLRGRLPIPLPNTQPARINYLWRLDETTPVTPAPTAPATPTTPPATPVKGSGGWGALFALAAVVAGTGAVVMYVRSQRRLRPA
jgi:hypothetical protein